VELMRRYGSTREPGNRIDGFDVIDVHPSFPRGLGRYRSLAADRERWDQEMAASHCQPPNHSRDPKRTLAAEAADRWARNRAG
jgi:hypothetical protein